MRSFTRFSIILLLVACGESSITSPPPAARPQIVQLLAAAPDTGFWYGDSLNLATLVRAVTDSGDTIAQPAVTWTVPAGFTLRNGILFATRESRGTLTATLATASSAIARAPADSGPPSVNVTLTSVVDLTQRGWTASWRCYDNPSVMRDVENPPIGADSTAGSFTTDSVTYGALAWNDVFPVSLWVDQQVIIYWRDGLVTTTPSQVRWPLSQDTLYLWWGTGRQSADNAIPQSSLSPLVYTMDSAMVAEKLCSGSRGGSGGPMILQAP